MTWKQRGRNKSKDCAIGKCSTIRRIGKKGGFVGEFDLDEDFKDLVLTGEDDPMEEEVIVEGLLADDVDVLLADEAEVLGEPKKRPMPQSPLGVDGNYRPFHAPPLPFHGVVDTPPSPNETKCDECVVL